jgi:hypothetical protein
MHIKICEPLDIYVRRVQTPGNIFDNLPALAAPKAADLLDELDRYLVTDPEQTEDALAWWNERRHSFPALSRMALNYLTIPSLYCFPRITIAD